MAETNVTEAVNGDQSLTSSNYQNWKVYMQNFLSNLNLWDIINGTESEPDAADQKYHTWVMKNEMALNAVKTSCRPEMVLHLQGITSAKTAWDQLASLQSPASSSAEEKGESKEIQHGDDDRPDALPETEDSFSGEPEYIRFRPFYKALIKGDWETAKETIEDDPGALTAKITHAGETALHVAILSAKLNTVKELLKLLPPEALEAKSNPGNPAISFAASLGITEIAKLVVEKNNGVLRIINQYGRIPLVAAVLNGKEDMVRYLYSVTPEEELDPDTSKNGATFLTGAITAEMYDIALDALELYPNLAISEDLFGKTAIAELARKSSAFPSGSRFGFWQKWLYSSCVQPGFSEDLITAIANSFPGISTPRIRSPESTSGELCTDVKSSPGIMIPLPNVRSPIRSRSRRISEEIIFLSKSSGSRFGSWMQHLYSSCLFVVPGVKDIQKKKIKHAEVLILLKVVCSAIGLLAVEELKDGKIDDAIHLTATNGNIEVFMELLDANPCLVYSISSSKRTLYHQAVMSRQVNIFNFISSMGQRDSRATALDDDQNNLLHFAGVLPSPSQLDKISGAALQMQRALQWFQEVEKIVQSKFKEFVNKDGITPAQLFTKEHKALKKDGEAWMKETANACMLVSALIATVMFAAAFTVPGGNVESTGTPFFLKTTAFTIFIVSDAISLFASCTSILMFFAILTARYAEQDFLKSLPKKLIIGLASLFISIAAMMAAFGATLVIVLQNRVTWVSIPVTLLATVPVALFGFLQFPLFIDIVRSTYGTGIFTWQKANLKNNK
ncbi:hypothetical protein C5167_044648 [Papaver somniferum]|uniref:PGG domain-containing protein n=1 Tax=Papaver somniferum TaxID=3469 RepID=A0A4Y7LCR5_PAPSO|nr:ankyrin repeat-containing protein NPR4-like isoform X2 [Papaver somniferum]RZC82071.1 hypothetical protein C5167_044648 [Papaver somniferum]